MFVSRMCEKTSPFRIGFYVVTPLFFRIRLDFLRGVLDFIEYF